MGFRYLTRVIPIILCVTSLCGAVWVAFGGDWLGTSDPQPNAAPQGTKQPAENALVFQEFDIDLGRITRTAEASFRFENRGDVAATILSVKGSCACAVAALAEKVIPPGGQGVISVRYTLKPEQIGDQSAQIVVEYIANGPRKTILVVRAKY